MKKTYEWQGRPFTVEYLTAAAPSAFGGLSGGGFVVEVAGNRFFPDAKLWHEAQFPSLLHTPFEIVENGQIHQGEIVPHSPRFLLPLAAYSVLVDGEKLASDQQ